jgi:hypothetical protein
MGQSRRIFSSLFLLALVAGLLIAMAAAQGSYRAQLRGVVSDAT